jgi:hypothetical protein
MLAALTARLRAALKAGRADWAIVLSRGGKVNRSAFAESFDLKGGNMMARYPKIRELPEEFDERVAAESYLPKELEHNVARFSAILVGVCPIKKDRVEVNLVALPSALGIPLSDLARAPYAALIRPKNEEFLRAARQNRVDPYFHGRVAVFSSLTSPRPWAFVESVAVRFKQIYGG